MIAGTSTITQDEYDALKITLAARDAEIERLREALTIMLYEATCMSPAGSVGDQLCRIPAGAISRARAALQLKESLKARVKKVEAIRDGLIMETWLKGIDAALQHKEDNQ